MPPVNNAPGKSGTITPEEFTTLSSLVNQYGPLVIALKVGKVCSKMSAGYLHEFPNSPVGLAWGSLATKISTPMASTRGSVSSQNFNFLGDLVTTYGPEVVIQKIAKIASKAPSMKTNATTLKALFPKVKATATPSLAIAELPKT